MAIKPVMVLDGSQRSALAVTRSLGRRNVPVITASEHGNALCRYSKYSNRHVEYPDPKHTPDEFMRWLKNFLGGHDISVVFPLTDITSNIIAPAGPIISGVKVPLTDLQSIETLSDKAKLVELAEQLGIPYPKSIHIHRIEQLKQIVEHITYPCVVKPSFSRFLRGGKWVDTAVTIVNSEKQLFSLVESQTYLSQQPFMLQEYIDGAGQGIFALYAQGEEVIWFAHKRLREKPPWGGVSVLSQSIAPPARMVDIARKLLDSAAWHGVAMVEFKVTKEGTPYLIEVNTRFWGSLQLAMNAGVDFPYLLYRITMGDSVDEQADYYHGTKLRWFLGDLDSLIITLKNNDYSRREKLVAVRRFFTPDFQHTKHEIFQFGDARPALFEMRDYFRSLISP